MVNIEISCLFLTLDPLSCTLDILKQSTQLFSAFYITILYFQSLMGRVRPSVIGDI